MSDTTMMDGAGEGSSAPPRSDYVTAKAVVVACDKLNSAINEARAAGLTVVVRAAQHDGLAAVVVSRQRTLARSLPYAE